MKKIWQHPLFRIFIFGILLGVILLLNFGPGQPDMEDKKVIIDDSDMAHMVASWQRTWKRLPTEEELKGVLQKYIQDEVVYREALIQGLDKNNAVVKRALITQMDMLAEGQSSYRELKEEDLRAYYELRKEQFISPGALSFFQVYFSEDRDSTSLSALVEQWNTSKSAPYTHLRSGDNTMLPQSLTETQTGLIDREFGTGFSASLLEFSPGKWHGPVSSPFGWHLVYIESKRAPTPQPFEKALPKITMQLEYEEKQAAREQFYTELMQQYDIIYQGIAKEFINE